MMRIIGYIIAASIAMAAFKAAIVLGAIILLILFLFQLITRPAETFALAMGLSLLAMAQAYPLAGLLVIGGLLLLGLIDRRC